VLALGLKIERVIRSSGDEESRDNWSRSQVDQWWWPHGYLAFDKEKGTDAIEF